MRHFLNCSVLHVSLCVASVQKGFGWDQRAWKWIQGRIASGSWPQFTSGPTEQHSGNQFADLFLDFNCNLCILQLSYPIFTIVASYFYSSHILFLQLSYPICQFSYSIWPSGNSVTMTLWFSTWSLAFVLSINKQIL